MIKIQSNYNSFLNGIDVGSKEGRDNCSLDFIVHVITVHVITVQKDSKLNC
jgi:hypothetical protein